MAITTVYGETCETIILKDNKIIILDAHVCLTPLISFGDIVNGLH